MLIVTCKPFMLSVVMLNVIMLSIVMLSVAAPLIHHFITDKGNFKIKYTLLIVVFYN